MLDAVTTDELAEHREIVSSAQVNDLVFVLSMFFNENAYRSHKS